MLPKQSKNQQQTKCCRQWFFFFSTALLLFLLWIVGQRPRRKFANKKSKLISFGPVAAAAAIKKTVAGERPNKLQLESELLRPSLSLSLSLSNIISTPSELWVTRPETATVEHQKWSNCLSCKLSRTAGSWKLDVERCLLHTLSPSLSQRGYTATWATPFTKHKKHFNKYFKAIKRYTQFIL